MKNFAWKILIHLVPDLADPNLNRTEHYLGIANAATALYLLPFAIFSVLWLVVISLASAPLTTEQLLLLGSGFLFLLVLNRMPFAIEFELRGGLSANFAGSLDVIIVVALILSIGPIALWLRILLSFIEAVILMRARDENAQISIRAQNWELVRMTISNIAQVLFAGLISLTLYQALGGTYPLQDLHSTTILRGAITVIVLVVIATLMILPYLAYISSSRLLGEEKTINSMGPLRFFGLAALVTDLVPQLFGVLIAGIYGVLGLVAYLFCGVGLVLVGLLTRQFSRIVRRERQRSRELDRLEQLGRSLLKAPPDASTLAEVLREYIPGMFSQTHINIFLYPDHLILNNPEFMRPAAPEVWKSLQKQTEFAIFPAETIPPWGGKKLDQHIIVVPIVAVEGGGTLGMVYLARGTRNGPINDLLSAAQSLAAQIASAFHEANIYRQMVEHERAAQELMLAGRIQESFIPKEIPLVAGWQVSALLDPARETSGDFYDMIDLPEGRIGLVVADVADKGVGAALFMALSRTLLRTYAAEYGDQPALALSAVNRRILEDTDSNLFVTLFYGILDATSGTLTYSSAGHNPAYLISPDRTVQMLRRTGIPLGMFDDTDWADQVVNLKTGDTLILYTDGVTEAQNGEKELFGEDRFLTVSQQQIGQTAPEISKAVLEAVRGFVGSAPQFDDITLMVLTRTA